MSPTRELADQTYQVVQNLSNYTEITSCKVVGGTRVQDCIQDLRKNPHVVVGTPGRILDMLQKQHLYTQQIKTTFRSAPIYIYKEIIHLIQL